MKEAMKNQFMNTGAQVGVVAGKLLEKISLSEEGEDAMQAFKMLADYHFSCTTTTSDMNLVNRFIGAAYAFSTLAGMMNDARERAKAEAKAEERERIRPFAGLDKKENADGIPPV